jgi:hypothetical protein
MAKAGSKNSKPRGRRPRREQAGAQGGVAASNANEAVELLTARLRRCLSAPGDPSMSEVEAQQKRCVLLMGELAKFFQKAAPDLSAAFARIGMSVDDLSRGTVGLLVTPAPPSGSPLIPSEIWHLRLQAALGFKCLLSAGMSNADAGKLAAKEAPELQQLVRRARPSAGRRREVPTLERSLRGWLVSPRQHKESLQLLEAQLETLDKTERRRMGVHMLRAVAHRFI